MDISMRWLRASNQWLPRTTGSNLAHAVLWRILQTKASGCQRPLKPWCLVPVCEHGHGGCDDISGDTRLARGLPFGRMLLLRPPPPMPEGRATRGTARWHMQSVVKARAHNGSVARVGRVRRSESSSISMPLELMWGQNPIGWQCLNA